MDRANVVRKNLNYDPTEFISNEPRALVDAERTTWPTRLGLLGIAILVVSSLLAPVIAGATVTGLMFAAVFAGCGLFGMANYLSYRMGERVWLGPDLSSRVVVGCFFLCLTSLVAAFVR